MEMSPLANGRSPSKTLSVETRTWETSKTRTKMFENMAILALMLPLLLVLLV